MARGAQVPRPPGSLSRRRKSRAAQDDRPPTAPRLMGGVRGSSGTWSGRRPLRAGSISGPNAPGLRILSANPADTSRTWAMSSGLIVSSCPVAWARSHPCTTRSVPRNRSTASSKVVVPANPSNSAVAASGSSRWPWITERVAFQAPRAVVLDGWHLADLPAHETLEHSLGGHDVADEVAHRPFLARRRDGPLLGCEPGDPVGETVGQSLVTVADLGHGSILPPAAGRVAEKTGEPSVNHG